jgi:internalin A
LPDIQFDEDDRSFIDPDKPGRKPHKISGAALRTLHEFLKEKDPDQVWGGLTRTTTPEGDVLWLCKEHIKEVYPTSNT